MRAWKVVRHGGLEKTYPFDKLRAGSQGLKRLRKEANMKRKPFPQRRRTQKSRNIRMNLVIQHTIVLILPENLGSHADSKGRPLQRVRFVRSL